MNRKSGVAILYGGKSVEHKISLRSARNIFENLDLSRFDPVLIGIDQEGNWFYLPEFNPDIGSGYPLHLHLKQEGPVFHCSEPGISPGRIDVAFPVLHGNDGEDGSIQGLFKTLNIPVVGTGVTGSAVSMDKILTKKLLRDAGISVCRYRHFTFELKASINYKEIVNDLGLPLIIKPVSSGSSVGVSKIRTEEKFYQAIEDTFQYDNELMIEEFIDGREMECAVKGNANPVASLPGEIIVGKQHDFYSFEAKYVDDQGASLEIPAKVPPDLVTKIQAEVIRAYQTLKCEDYSRVDFFLTKNDEIIINEINTIPGFTDISMFPQLWKLSGISYMDLITELIEESIKRNQRNLRLKHIFESKL